MANRSSAVPEYRGVQLTPSGDVRIAPASPTATKDPSAKVNACTETAGEGAGLACHRSSESAARPFTMRQAEQTIASDALCNQSTVYAANDLLTSSLISSSCRHFTRLATQPGPQTFKIFVLTGEKARLIQVRTYGSAKAARDARRADDGDLGPGFLPSPNGDWNSFW